MDKLNLFSDLPFVYSLIIRLFSVGIVISSLEYLYSLADYSARGIFAWRVLKLAPKVLQLPLYFQRFDALFEKSGVCILMVVRLAASLYLAVFPVTVMTALLLGALAFVSLLVSFRSSFGNDGSDQMNQLVCLTLLVSCWCKDEAITRLGIYFTCFQVIISYEAAGIAKLISPKWNGGMAIYEIMNTMTYGSKTVAALLRRLPAVWTKVLNWNIIIFECLYFMVIFLPCPYCFIFLVWGILFHLYNAVYMGLNGFLWAFLACYPAILYVNHLLQG